MVSKVKRYFLEIKNFSSKSDLKISKNFTITLNNKKNYQLNKFFYKQIGKDHFWRDRLFWSDQEWLTYVSNKNLETYILKKGDDLAGYYEQEYHPASNETELINMGILKEFRGLKLGSKLLEYSLLNAFKKKPNRIWVHTCSLDHKYALHNYKSKGFKIFKEEELVLSAS